MEKTQLSAYPDSKKHYEILDGLRGVAAIMVVIFHLLEAHATSHLDQIINHGYLAVDFFYLLSGFVIAYAYDDRWGKMSIKDFFIRRLIRLHPMIILGMVVGAVAFYFQAGSLWPRISEVPVWNMLLVMLLGFTLLPLPISMDIRGWAEMHPLDGPAWSLFFEYIANILYAFFLRRLSNKVLAVLVFIAGAMLIHLAVAGPNGDVVGGWALEPTQLRIGFIRMLYPFLAGMFLFRVATLSNIRYAFLLSSVLVVAVLTIPRIGGSEHLWMNGLYDSLSIILLFPLIVYVGASGEVKGKFATRLCRFLGDISYPIYITHYPLIYTYTAWVYEGKVSIPDAMPVAVVVLLSSIVLAYASLKLYDVPLRSWISSRFLKK
ncbi:MAG: acyltransferase [Bacteroidia bacterium]